MRGKRGGGGDDGEEGSRGEVRGRKGRGKEEGRKAEGRRRRRRNQEGGSQLRYRLSIGQSSGRSSEVVVGEIQHCQLQAREHVLR